MDEIVKCPACGSEGESTAQNCTKCKVYIRSELECIRDIDASLKRVDASLKTITNIAVWWLILSILGVIIGVIYGLSQAR